MPQCVTSNGAAVRDWALGGLSNLLFTENRTVRHVSGVLDFSCWTWHPICFVIIRRTEGLVQLLKNEVYVLKKQKGFSLIELLIVVAIILIIAAIAIPNLLRSRMAANEASAVGSIRSINTAAVTYSSTYPAAGYPANLKNLGTSGAATSASADLVY